MTGVVQPSREQVRAAAEALKSAIDRHLTAVEQRSGESDPAVFDAYDELASAAEAYDELLYDAYDEVTPFEVPDSDDSDDYTGPDDPEAITVLIRRDYRVRDRAALIEHARRAEAEADVEDPGFGSEPAAPEPENTVESTSTALAVVFDLYDPDEIAQRADEIGLEAGDSTLWVAAVDPAEPGEWLEAPFDEVDAQSVVYRFETSTAYEDDLTSMERDLRDLREP